VTELAEACVRLLGQWRTTWPARPQVVVDLAAAGFGRVVGQVADHLATVGRLERATLPVPGTLPDSRELSSAEEAARWCELLTPVVPTELVAGRVVLLVVDASSSLWPVTVAASVLRRAGAELVLPLLLHRRP
jgi:ATP-dependent DNA helicase RecQ